MTSGIPQKNIPFEEIFAIQSTSNKSVSAIAEEMGLNKFTVLKQLREDNSLQVQVTQARRQQAEFIVSSMLDKIDAIEQEVKSPLTDPQTKTALCSVLRTRVDTIKWIACKYAPYLYGDNITVSHDVSSVADRLKALFPQEKITANQPVITVLAKAEPVAKRGRGRPLGSKGKKQIPETVPVISEVENH